MELTLDLKPIKSTIPAENTLNELADFFKVFGDLTRIKIIYALGVSEMCVSDISVLFNMQQSTVSHQLRILKRTRLVKHRREGKAVYYSLDDDHVKSIFSLGLDHIKEK